MYFRSTSDKSNKVYYLGEYNNGDTIDIASKYANYADLTADNFVVSQSVAQGGSVVATVSAYSDRAIGTTPTATANCGTFVSNKAYNQGTGKLTINSYLDVGATVWSEGQVGGQTRYYQASNSGQFGLKAKVYLIEGTIDTL